MPADQAGVYLTTRSRLLSLGLAALLASLGCATAAAANTTVGVADQTADTFADPLFGSLGLKHARLNLAWDVFEHDWQVGELDHWMSGAQAAGVSPLVIFSQSRVAGRTRLLPNPDRYRNTVKTLRARYPFVRDIAGWNEMNYPGQPTFRRPKAVAQYYKILREECRGCNVLPGSLLDNPNMIQWTGLLRAEIRKLKQPEPRLWGLHNYSDVNRLRDTSTRALLKSVKGKVWLTETGGVVNATSPTASKYPQGEGFAGKVVGYLLGPFAKRNPRVERIYLYEWKAPRPDGSWDSGIISPVGRERPAYGLIKKFLGR